MSLNHLLLGVQSCYSPEIVMIYVLLKQSKCVIQLHMKRLFVPRRVPRVIFFIRANELIHV